MICSQKGVDHVYEPLQLGRHHPHFLRLPHPPLSKFITLDRQEEGLLHDYFQALLSGELRLRNQWNPLGDGFSFFVDRLVVKVLSANALIDWFAQHFDIDVIYLLRHPIPVAASLIKRGSANFAPAYLENPHFCEAHLDPATFRLAQDILASGSTLQKYVLEWCLENLYPLEVCGQREWLTLTYEELVLRPMQISELICARFNLRDPVRMSETADRPSRTTTADSDHRIRSEGPGSLVEQSLQEVGSEEIEGVERLLEGFGVDVYKASSPYPSLAFSHFGALN